MEKNTELEASGCSDPGAPLMLQAESQEKHSPGPSAKKFAWTIKDPISLEGSQPRSAEQEAKSCNELTFNLASAAPERPVLPSDSPVLELSMPPRPQDPRQVEDHPTDDKKQQTEVNEEPPSRESKDHLAAKSISTIGQKPTASVQHH